MAGRRLKGPRSGDLGEELGVLLLKIFSAVATVPRPEDVGIDAVATLLREGPDNLLIAEDSFYVQIKTNPKGRMIQYEKHEVQFLASLRLPFFIGIVDKEEARIELFTTHRLSQVLLEGECKGIRFNLDSGENLDAKIRACCIGPPVLKWDTTFFGDERFPARAYTILKPHIQAEQRNVNFRSMGYCESIQWKEGEVPQCQIGNAAFHVPETPEEVKGMLGHTVQALQALLSHCLLSGDQDGHKAVMGMVEYTQRRGINVDSFQMLNLMGRARRSGKTH
jgi:hypothetical protein